MNSYCELVIMLYVKTKTPYIFRCMEFVTVRKDKLSSIHKAFDVALPFNIF